MKAIIIKTAVLFSIIVVCVFLMPSLNQKGGVRPFYYTLIVCIAVAYSSVWILPITRLNYVERIVLVIPTTFLSLFVSAFFITSAFVDYRYFDKTWKLWDFAERLITNSVFYGSIALMIIAIVELYHKVSRSVRAKMQRISDREAE